MQSADSGRTRGGSAHAPNRRGRADGSNGSGRSAAHAWLVVASDHDVEVWQVRMATQRFEQRKDA